MLCRLLLLTPAALVFSCTKIRTGEELTPAQLRQLRQLGLLNSHERVYQFYSNAPFREASAGNFYSTERIASYWLDADKRKTRVDFAYYRAIARIDTSYLDKTLTYLSYLTITRRDGSSFRVYAGGKKPAVRAFFEQATAQWRASAHLCN